jgi:hypothetical protein
MSINSIKSALGLGAITGAAGLLVVFALVLLIAAVFGLALGLPALIVWVGWKLIAVGIFNLPALSYWTVLFGLWTLSVLVAFIRR